MDGRKVNKRAIEALIRSGALDLAPQGDVGYKRAVMHACMDDALKSAEQKTRNANSGMTDLFAHSESDNDLTDPYIDYHKSRPLSVRERLNGEKETLGLYLTGHPIDEYVDELKLMLPNRISDLRANKDKTTIYGMVYRHARNEK